jgi:hypothetical protein
MHSGCWKLTLCVWICPHDARVRCSGECTVSGGAIAPAGARGERPCVFDQANPCPQSERCAPPRDRDLIFSNDAKKAVLFVGAPAVKKTPASRGRRPHKPSNSSGVPSAMTSVSRKAPGFYQSVNCFIDLFVLYNLESRQVASSTVLEK